MPANTIQLISSEITLAKGKYLVVSSVNLAKRNANFRLRRNNTDKLFAAGGPIFNGIIEVTTDSATVGIYCDNYNSESISLSFDPLYEHTNLIRIH